jgi:dipeptidyl aminopeptidase/acylaminoacyl peptidase
MPDRRPGVRLATGSLVGAIALLASPNVALTQVRALTPADTATLQPVTHEAIWMMKRVGTPSVSPNGLLVVFPITEPSYDEKNEHTDLWIVPADGHVKPRQLTAAHGAESEVRWSPDSQKIAFSARRDGDEVNQIYVLKVAGGGEARRITASPMAARGPVWSPDGTWIAYQSAVYPGSADLESNRRAAAERKYASSNVRRYETFPIRRWDRWLDDTRTHLFVVRADGESASGARDVLARTALAAQPGFGGGAGEGASDDLAPDFTPDGHSLVFVATTNRTAAAYSWVNTHLFSVAVAGGEPTALTSGRASYGTPHFAPDGRSICYKVADNWERVYALDRLACARWPLSSSAAAQTLTSDFDRSVTDFAVAPDNRLYLTAEDEGFLRLYSVPLAGGAVTPVTDTRGAFAGLSIASSVQPAVVITSWGSATEPNEIVRVDPLAKRTQRLSEVNVNTAARLGWQPLQEFWFTNALGRRVHNFIVLPPEFDAGKKYPLFLFLHGGPANMWRDQISLRGNYHLLAAPGYVVLLTDYRGSTGYGEQFSLDILKNPLKGPADDVNLAADEAIKRFPFVDASRQAAFGGSYGAHLTNWLEATTTRYKCLISHAGLSSLETQWSTSDAIRDRELTMGMPFWENPDAWLAQSPIARARDFKTPLMLSVGERDFRVPINNTLEMYAVMQRMQVPVRLLVWPDANHWIMKPEDSRVFYRELADWLHRWLQ